MPKEKQADVNSAIAEKVRRKFIDLNPSLTGNNTFNHFTEDLPKYPLKLLEKYLDINPDMDEQTIKLLEAFEEFYNAEIRSGLEKIVAPKKGDAPAGKPEEHSSPPGYSGELKDHGIYTLAQGAEAAGIDIFKLRNAQHSGNITTVKHPTTNKIVTSGLALRIFRDRPQKGKPQYDADHPQPKANDIVNMINGVTSGGESPAASSALNASANVKDKYNPEGILNAERIKEILGVNQWGLKAVFSKHPELKTGENLATTQEKLAKYVIADEKADYPNSKRDILGELGFASAEEAAKQLGVSYKIGRGEKKIEVQGLKKLNYLISGLPSTVVPGILLAAKLPLDLVIEEGCNIGNVSSATISKRTRRIMDDYSFLTENKEYHKIMNKAYMIGKDFAEKLSASTDMERIKATAASLDKLISGS